MANLGKRLFCSKPFTWFEVSEVKEGDEVYVCCPNWLSTSIGNLTRQSVAEIWNGPTAQKLRESILDGSFRYCSFELCPFLHTISGPVQPVEEVTDERMRTVIRDRLTVLPFGPREVVCCYDKSCNLECPSCRTEIIIETKNKERILAIQKKLENEALGDAQLLYITGSGDPFGSPFFRRWLQSMEREQIPNVRTIHLHSNGLLWTRRMWETIPPDIRTLIREAEISIDAASAETYAVNRRGGKFSRLLENLTFISELRAKGPLKWLGISMVVQENNFTEMPDFVRLGERFGVDVVYFSRIVNWGTFSEREYRTRAVHLPDHARHEDFKQLLASPIFDSALVNLGNLGDLRAQPVA